MGAYGEGAGKHAEDDVRGGGGSDVVVLRLAAEEEVPNAASGEVCVMACGAEGSNDFEGRCELGLAGHAFSRCSVRG